MGDLTDFQRGQTVDAPLAGAFVITTVSLLSVSSAAVVEVMTDGIHIMGRLHQMRRTVV
jgi:hypothetical protein